MFGILEFTLTKTMGHMPHLINEKGRSQMKIIYSDDLEREQIKTEQESKGMTLVKDENHIVISEDGSSNRVNALVFSETPPVEDKSLAQRLQDIESRLSVLEDN